MRAILSALNPAVLSYHPPQSTAILNWYLYTYAVSALTMYLGGYFLPAAYRKIAPALHGAGTLLPAFGYLPEIGGTLRTAFMVKMAIGKTP